MKPLFYSSYEITLFKDEIMHVYGVQNDRKVEEIYKEIAKNLS